MPGRILVTGGSGFVGSTVVDELLARGYLVNTLTHRRAPRAAGEQVRAVPGGLFDEKALDEALADCNAVIHLVGIIRERPDEGVTFRRIHVEGTEAVIRAAAKAQVKRFVHMSALGTRPDAASEYHRTKYEAEERLRASELHWTIFRPSLIHGPGGELMEMESRWARGKAPPYLAMPYFAAGLLGRKGGGRIQPVYVGDVARAFVDALERPKTIGEVYPLGGPEELTWAQFHRLCAKLLTGKRRRTLGIPAWFARALTRIVPASLLPYTADQVTMSLEDNVCDLGKFREDFGWEPRRLCEAMAQSPSAE